MDWWVAGDSGFLILFLMSVIAVGEIVPPLILVEGGGNAMDVDAFPYPPAMPVIVTRENLNIFLAEVMLCICSVLHDG